MVVSFFFTKMKDVLSILHIHFCFHIVHITISYFPEPVHFSKWIRRGRKAGTDRRVLDIAVPGAIVGLQAGTKSLHRSIALETEFILAEGAGDIGSVLTVLLNVPGAAGYGFHQYRFDLFIDHFFAAGCCRHQQQDKG